MVFSQPFLVRPRVRLPEKENRRICQISGLKSGRARSLKKSEKWSPTREFLKQSLGEKQNAYLQSGRLREVVAVREFTVWKKSWLVKRETNSTDCWSAVKDQTELLNICSIC